MNRFLHHGIIAVVVSSLFAVLPASAETTITGRVIDAARKPVAGALLSAGPAHTTTGDDGTFTLVISSPAREINVTHPRYVATRISLATPPEQPLTIALAAVPIVSEDMVVTAIRADDASPVTKKDLGRSEIDDRYYGQDMPALLSATPSVTTYS